MIVEARHARAARLQVQQEGAGVLGPECGRRFAHMRSTPAHRGYVTALRALAKAAQRHVVDHALAKGVNW
jgi:hypothetical protein